MNYIDELSRKVNIEVGWKVADVKNYMSKLRFTNFDILHIVEDDVKPKMVGQDEYRTNKKVQYSLIKLDFFEEIN